MIRPHIIAFPVLAMLSGISCTTDVVPVQPSDAMSQTYDEALARWNSLNLHDYVLYQRYRGWGPGVTGPVRLLVRSDTMADIRLVSNDSVLDYSWQRFQTIGQLFSQIEEYRAMDTSRYILRVEYDSLYGYPDSWNVHIDPPPTDFSVGHNSWGLQPL